VGLFVAGSSYLRPSQVKNLCHQLLAGLGGNACVEVGGLFVATGVPTDGGMFAVEGVLAFVPFATGFGLEDETSAAGIGSSIGGGVEK
jgi:hypothetical protein